MLEKEPLLQSALNPVAGLIEATMAVRGLTGTDLVQGIEGFINQSSKDDVTALGLGVVLGVLMSCGKGGNKYFPWALTLGVTIGTGACLLKGETSAALLLGEAAAGAWLTWAAITRIGQKIRGK